MEKDETEMSTEERDNQSELREKLRIVKTVLEQVWMTDAPVQDLPLHTCAGSASPLQLLIRIPIHTFSVMNTGCIQRHQQEGAAEAGEVAHRPPSAGPGG